MSGRGRAGGSSNTMRSVANALGIARYDMAKMMSQQKIEPPQLYPKVQRDPVPLEMTTDMIYVSRVKVELDQRMRDSQFFVEVDKDEEIKRYLDKYSVIKRGKLELDMSQLPSELSWKRTAKDPARKKRKIATDDVIKEKLQKLEEKEKGQNEEEDEEKGEEDGDTGSEKSANEEGENPLSDDDNGEEDNDYISNYFDNGEGYGDGGSDDNMDGDEY